MCNSSRVNVNVLWYDNRDGNTEIYYKRNPNGNPVAVTNINTRTPSEFSLSQNYPNPFNPSTTILFNIPSERGVRRWGVSTSLIIYDIMGNEVKVLLNHQLQPGSYSINFDAGGLASGMYFYKLISGEFSDTKN